MSEPRQIPLHDFHARQGARFVDFGGWNMPVQYSSILEEHKTVREAAGLFDVSHMGEFLLHGPGTAGFLDYLLCNRISNCRAGKAIYSPMCDAEGGVIDDLIVYRIEENRFLLCVNAGNIEKDYDWISKQLASWPEAVQLEDQSSAYCLLAVQGPKAETILKRAGFIEAASIGRFCHAEHAFGSGTVRLCRTGYTGEDGFEIYVNPDKAEALAEALLEAGSNEGLQLCGLGARDSLRLEAGLPLYGHELDADISPLEAGLGWAIKLEKDDFIGKAALVAQKGSGLLRTVLFYKLQGRRIARAGTEVINDQGAVVGKVLSGTSSPMVNGPIGSALVETCAINEALLVELRGNPVELTVSKPPLHK
mgnify:CR=1 FL=1